MSISSDKKLDDATTLLLQPGASDGMSSESKNVDSTTLLLQPQPNYGSNANTSVQNAVIVPPIALDGMALVVVLVFLFFGILNNVGATMMGYVMPTFPAWLLYFTTFLYTILFFCIATYKNEQPLSVHQRTRPKMRQYLILAVWTTINGMTFQFSNVWLDGDLQQVLINLGVPFTFAVAYYYFRRGSTRCENFGYGLVLVGIVVGVLPSANKLISNDDSDRQSDHWYWVLTFIVSVFFAALQEIQQEVAYDPTIGCSKATTLFWFNLMSLPWYLLAILFEAAPYFNGTYTGTSISDAFVNQQNAFLCYFNTPTASDVTNEYCLPMSWFWPSLFVVGYAGFYYFYAVLIERFGVVYATVINSLIPPLAAAVFDSAAIVGAHNQKDFDYRIGISFGIILCGILVKTKYRSQPVPPPLATAADPAVFTNDGTTPTMELNHNQPYSAMPNTTASVPP